jgi:CxxC motif-containing protein
MKKELTCIVCPLSCLIRVSCEAGKLGNIEGALCSKGRRYAEKEITCPTRPLATTIEVVGGEHKLVSVKSDKELPKELIMPAMRHLATVRLQAPVVMGQVAVADILATGVNIVTTRPVKGDRSG